jgi:perosamine synthetase
MKVPQVQPWLGLDEYEAIKSCFTDNWVTEGPKSAEFRSQLLELTGAEYGEFAPNGTLAIYLGLMAAGIGPGDEVIVPDFTFIATANAVAMAGATPVFADVTSTNFQIDVEACESRITPRTKAIMPAHMYGMVSNMSAIMELANRHEIMVIEDAAQALGVNYNGQHAGTFGKVGCFSFFADKAVTTGEGGFVITDDPEVAHNLKFLRNQGREDRGSFIHPEIGFNFRMTDIHAAIGLTQLGKLPEAKRRKLQALQWFKDGLADVEEVKFLELEPGSERIPFRTCITANNAHELMDYMDNREIQARTFFYPLHKQPAFEEIVKTSGVTSKEFPNSIYAYENGICLPAFPELSQEQVEYTVGVIKDFYARTSA